MLTLHKVAWAGSLWPRAIDTVRLITCYDANMVPGDNINGPSFAGGSSCAGSVLHPYLPNLLLPREINHALAQVVPLDVPRSKYQGQGETVDDLLAKRIFLILCLSGQ